MTVRAATPWAIEARPDSVALKILNYYYYYKYVDHHYC